MKIRRRSVYGTLERPVWELTIVGKGRRERAVPVSAATLAALHAHWADRDKDFEGAKVGSRSTSRAAAWPSHHSVDRGVTPAHRREGGNGGMDETDPGVSTEVGGSGYTADGLNRLIGRMLKVLVETMDALSLDERTLLGQANADAFRHSFGTQSVADEVPVDVVQKVLGHASFATTTIYVQAEKKRVLEVVAGYYAGRTERGSAKG
ncbi:integrase [Caballeronia choica]|uniref:Integrase n=1 Tax=Caballeronia choica TaxID=326476 RepID=A0A158KSU8_9BURK|nr:tyrosine-type recombinase/integrase [Caballeronia choica]SAL83511.1 integrase [Caballeronia choica]